MYNQASRLREIVRQPGLREPQDRTDQARVLSVVSGKGGVGKTNLVLNLGIALSQKGKRVLIIDGDIRAADVDTLAGVDFPGSLTRVSTGQQSLSEAVVAGPAGVQIIMAHESVWPGIKDGKSWTQDEMEYAIELTRAEWDWVLIDTDAGLSGESIDFIKASDEVIILTTGEPTALTGTYTVIKQLMRYGGNPLLSVIVNGVESEEESKITLHTLNVAVEHFLGYSLPGSGWLPWDACIPEAVCKQEPFVLAYPDNPASRCLRKMADSLAA